MENVLPGYVYSLLLLQQSLKGEKFPFVFGFLDTFFNCAETNGTVHVYHFLMKLMLLKYLAHAICNAPPVNLSTFTALASFCPSFLQLSVRMSEYVRSCCSSEELLAGDFFFFFLFHDVANCGHRNRSYEMRL